MSVVVQANSGANGLHEAKRFKKSAKFDDDDSSLSVDKLAQTYRSNLFDLELDELVAAITPSEQSIKTADAVLKELNKVLKSLKTVPDLKFSDLPAFEAAKRIKLPFSELYKQMEGSYTFQAPSEVQTGSAFATKSAIKTKQTSIDLLVEMPRDFFTERDYLNYRYFLKRNVYMAHVYAQLAESKALAKRSVEFAFVANYSAQFKPLLSLNFKDASISVVLHFVPNAESFKAHRFNPCQNNVRSEWFAKHFPDSSLVAGTTDGPCPGYNFELLSDLRAIANNKLIEEAIDSNGLREGLQLVKLWLKKRDLNQGYGCLDDLTVSLFVVFLVRNHNINRLMTRYQIFRIVLLKLSEANWHEKGITLPDSTPMETENSENVAVASRNVENKPPPFDEFHKHYEVVFIDVCGFLNLTGKVSRSTLQRVKLEAAWSIKYLNNECFEHLFIRDQCVEERFDALVCISPNRDEHFYDQVVRKASAQGQLVNFMSNSYCVAFKLAADLLQRALGERTNLIFVKPIPDQTWSIDSNANVSAPDMVVGLLFNDKYDRVLIKGPMSQSAEAATFRKFWGAKSELRRFEDTSICEAVLFEPASTDSSAKRLIYTDIMKYLFKLHLAVDETHLRFCDRQLNSVLGLPASACSAYGTGEERLADVAKTFDELSSLVRGMRELPIVITNMQGIDAAFRFTDVFAPLPCCFAYNADSEKCMQIKQGQKYVPKWPLGPVVAPYVKPIEVMCQLESSGKWPDDLACIGQLKTAFYLKLVKLVRENFGWLAFTSIAHCDIMFKGFVFRLSAYTMNELFCMRHTTNEHGVIVYKETAASMDYYKEIVCVPRVTTAIHALQHKHSSFSGVCRLAKRWLSSQLLLEFFSDEVVDLICAYLYLDQTFWEPPKSAMVGLLRFLDLLASFDWKNKPFVVNFNGELQKSQLDEINVKFKENRSSLAVMHIVTPYEGLSSPGSLWTHDKPSIQQLCRCMIVAKSSYSSLKQSMATFETSESFKKIFRPNVDIYDVVIKLKASMCVNAYQSVDLCEGTFLPRYRDFDESKTDKTFPITDFDPVRLYVEDLRATFSEFALFFYDLHGATSIYVLWKPDALKPKEVTKGSSKNKYRLIDAARKVSEMDVERILRDFKLVGTGLVEDVSIQNNSRLFK